jgi:YVTN family beta-propeller protein
MGKRLFVALNLSNRLAEFDALTGDLLWLYDVGVAPYDVALVGDKAYVSNWGGRRPQPGDLTGPAGRGTEVRVDSVRFIASEGSVTAIDLNFSRSSRREEALSESAIRNPQSAIDQSLVLSAATREIITGLHASALAVHPSQRYVVCANAASDNVSVIDTRNDTVVETIWVKQNPADLFGASPNALAFDQRGRRLYVANGTQNAIAVVDFDPGRIEAVSVSFPSAGSRARSRSILRATGLAVAKHQRTHDHEEEGQDERWHGIQFAPVSRLAFVAARAERRQLARLSAIVWRNFRQEQLEAAKLPPRSGQPPRPVPERIGEPSVFKHVVYIIKENRTYDQVLGDDKRGNGDSSLCIFGEKITPNQHKMVREFVLLDNTYCAGILSADGHQWSTTAFATDYMEKSFAGFPRSYPDGMGEDEADALAYSPGGFIWDNVIKHRKTLRNYGEFAAPAIKWRDRTKRGSPDFLACLPDVERRER